MIQRFCLVAVFALLASGPALAAGSGPASIVSEMGERSETNDQLDLVEIALKQLHQSVKFLAIQASERQLQAYKLKAGAGAQGKCDGDTTHGASSDETAEEEKEAPASGPEPVYFGF